MSTNALLYSLYLKPGYLAHWSP